MKEEKIITFDSDEAAKPITMTGWASYNGLFFHSEETARYAGATHIKCRECGIPTPKGYMICNDCRDKADMARWLKLEEKEWDGKTILYSESHDEYFVDADALCFFFDEAEEPRPSLESLRLVICVKQMYYTIDPYDYYADNFPEEGEPCDEIEEAFEELNKKIMDCKTPICWVPGKFRPTKESVWCQNQPI